MKNLNYLKLEYFSSFKEIVDSKDEKIVLSQPNLQNEVERRYKEYLEKFSKDKLFLVEDSTFPRNHTELIGCYKSKTKKVSELITDIKNAQTTEAKSKCQYCGLNKPKTIDHYLPLSLYPEFSVLAINLLPCCNECNKRKDNYWKAEGYRGIINFYIDNIPNSQFLFAELIMKNDVPNINFYLKLDSIDDDFSKIIESHFERLNLFERYIEESNDEISEMTRHFRIYLKDKTVSEKKLLLKDDSSDLKNRYGINYWKAVLYEAISSCEEFLEELSK